MVEVASVKDIHERARLATLQAVAGLTAPSIISLACSLADAGLSLERDGDLSEALCVYYQADNLIKHVLGTVEDKRKPIESQQELLYRQTKNLGEHVTSQILHRARKIEEQLKETEHLRIKPESDVRPTGSATNHLKILAETGVRAQTPAGSAKPAPPRPNLFCGPSPALLHTTSMDAGVTSIQHELNSLNNLADSRPNGKILPSAPALLPGASPSGLTTSTSISGVAETIGTLPPAPQPHSQNSLNTPAKTAKLPAPLRGLRGMFRRMVTPKPATNDLGTSSTPSPNSVVSANHGGAQLSSTRSRRLPVPPKPAHASTSMAPPHSIAGHQVVQSSTLGISISPKEANEHQPEPRENPTTDPFEDTDPLEVSDRQPRSLRAGIPIDMSRLSGPTAAPSLVGSEFGQAFARQNRVSPASSAFPTAPPNLEGPRLGSISTNGQLGVTFASATKVLPSLPEPPKTDGRSQFGLPPITNPVTALSLKAYLGTASQVLLLDVRPREDFEARRLPVDNAVCIEPTLLTCGRVSAMGLQGALRLSSVKEYALFERRDTFDLVVLCDEDSTTLTDPGRSLGVLLSIVYETTLLKPLRQPPAFLYGGVRAWGSDVGEFIRPQTKGNVVSRFTDAAEQLARQPTALSQPASGSISHAMIPQGTGLPGVSFFHQPSVHPKPPASWASLSGTHVHPHTHPTCQAPNSSLTHTRINPFVQYQPVNQLPCSICLEVPKIFPDKLPTARCKHAPQVCAGCLQEHIGFSVQKEGKTVITCPDPGCREELDYADVLRGANNHKEYIGRYETLLLRRVLEKDPNFVWCKNPSCNWGQVHESGANAPIVICQVCESRSCFTHDAPWHTGFTCKEYDAHMKRRVQIAKEEQASEQCIKQNSKKCPNISCGRPIQKNQGCDHMTCDKRVGCGHEL